MSASNFGYKVSLPGYDVRTATPEQCAVHSSYPPFKAKTGQSPAHFAQLAVDFTGGVTQNVVHTVYSFNHGYGYTPFVLPSLEFTDSGVPFTFPGVGYIIVGSTLIIGAYADSSQFFVTVYDDAFWINNNCTLNVSYYIFAENGA